MTMPRACQSLVCLVLCSLMGMHPVRAESIDDVRTDVGLLTTAVNALRGTYLEGALFERRYRFAARLTEAQAFFLKQDFDRAAIVLLDLVDEPASKRHRAYRDALFYLAESLFFLRNYVAAVSTYERLLVKGSIQQRSQALARLLEIAAKMNDRTLGARIIGVAERQVASTRNPTLLYGLGKYLFRIGQLSKAQRRFEQVPQTSTLYVKARYYLGTVLVRQKQLEKARVVFQMLAKLQVPALVEIQKNGNDADVLATYKIRNLSMLALARIAYELNEFDRAVDQYNQVPRAAVEFDDAMYESVWVAIKRKAYKAALRKLGLALVSKPDVLDGPDAHLLQGKLKMMLNEYEPAEAAFESVAKTFGEIEAEMLAIVKKYPSLERHFGRVIGNRIADFDLRTLLPASAARVVQNDKESNQALELVRDVAAQRRDVDVANRTIARLETALSAGNRAEMFPKLNDGLLKAQEYRATSLKQRARLNDLARESLSSRPAAYEDLYRQRITWGLKFQGVPQTMVRLKERDQRVDKKMAALDRETHRFAVELRNVDAQLIAVKKYLRDSDAEISDSNRRRLEEIVSNSEQLKGELKQLAARIEDERIRVGYNDYATTEDDNIYRRYKDALANEASWLAGSGSALDSNLLRTLERVEVKLGSFEKSVMRVVDERVVNYRKQLSSVRSKVGRYNRTLQGQEVETQTLGGAIAARSFRRVLNRISSLVLEADVGLIDVTWKMKIDKSKDIAAVLDKQRVEYENLDRAFNEVSGE
ncbi:MAG: tetratricopeptide repeat protein [Myxococcota bacterium]|nr:tetratricopeptide repeat protein [Myxococcota bacterium]